MKVCVYAICKNEEQFVRRWVASMSEADEIIVLDTGSTDRSVALLQELGVTVHQQIIDPWRFDTARNQSLALVPNDADLCVCTDLDEVFVSGWRQKAEAAFTNGVQQLQYRYTWDFAPDGTEGHVFFISKIHARHGFAWKHPVHEVLTYLNGQPVVKTAHGVQLNHYPDPAKSRGQYLPLLELSVQEAPEDDRNWHYLGREYYFYGRYADCIAALQHHLGLPTATWADERCASLRLIGKSHLALGQTPQAHAALLRAAAEAPHLREPWLDLARFYEGQQAWDGVIFACQQALRITHRPDTYITETASYGADPYDLLSLGYYYTGQLPLARQAIRQALAFSPHNARLQQNQVWMTEQA